MKFINTDVIHSDRKWGKLTKKINITLFNIKAFIVTGSFQLLIFWWWRKLLFDVAMPSLSFTPYSYSTTPPPPIIFPPPPWGICSNRSSLPNNLATLKSLQTHEHKQEATLYVTTWLFDIQCLYSEKAELHPFLWQSILLSWWGGGVIGIIEYKIQKELTNITTHLFDTYWHPWQNMTSLFTVQPFYTENHCRKSGTAGRGKRLTKKKQYFPFLFCTIYILLYRI